MNTGAVESNKSALPFVDLKVVEVGTMVAGPYSCAILADFGAEVIKVEPPYGDQLRRSSALADTGFWVNECNRGKRAIGIDLSTDRGKALLWALVAMSDAVVCNLRPDTLPKLGLDFETVRRINPQATLVTVSAFGSDGPYGARRGTAPTIDASSGLAYLTGYQGGGPLRPGNLFGDLSSAMYASLAVMAGVHTAKITGEGVHIDVSMTECVAHMLGEATLREVSLGERIERTGNVDLVFAPQNCYPCAGIDSWLTVSIRSEEEWAALVSVMGSPEWASDPRFDSPAARKVNQVALDGYIRGWTVGMEVAKVAETLRSVGIAAGAVLAPGDLRTDPQLAYREFYEDIENEKGELEPIPKLAGRFMSSSRPKRRRAPLYGEDTQYILETVLGLSTTEIADLYDAKVCFSEMAEVQP
jgi:crotonobetainyl-CoA:carnitine CoA-transferase CaiB-like acyl-CoA transferase